MKKYIYVAFSLLVGFSAKAQQYDTTITKTTDGIDIYHIHTITTNDGKGDANLNDVPLRPDGVIVDDYVNYKTPEQSKIHRRDVAFYARVYRDINVNDSTNSRFFTSYNSDKSNSLIDIIMNEAMKDSLKLFSSESDNFTKLTSPDQISQIVGDGTDTFAVYNGNGKVMRYEIRDSKYETKPISTYRIKEDWIYNRRTGQMETYIIGIAPLMNSAASNGKDVVVTNAKLPIFWVAYQDLKPFLINKRIANPFDLGNYITWDNVFEDRLFKGKIIKSSLDNTLNLTEPLSNEEGEKVEDILENYGNN